MTPQQALSPDKGSPRLDPIKILSKYEIGEKGTLHRMYAKIMEDWFIYCHSLGKKTFIHILVKKSSANFYFFVYVFFLDSLSRKTTLKQHFINMDAMSCFVSTSIRHCLFFFLIGIE